MRIRGMSEGQRIAEHCERVSRLETWHRWFAWYPVRLENGDLVWFETVWRRGIYNPGGVMFDDSPWVWLYSDEKETVI